MKTISLKQVFESVGYTPAPIEETGSDVMEEKQARQIVTRFAEDDATFFNFLDRQERASYLDAPFTYSMIDDCFKYYTRSPNPDFEIKLYNLRQQLKLTPEDTSGQIKTFDFIDLIKDALKCREVIERTETPSSSEVIDSLMVLSMFAVYARGRGLDLSDKQLDQVKNLALPVNPVDPILADPLALYNIYANHLDAKMKQQKRGRPKGGIGPKLI